MYTTFFDVGDEVYHTSYGKGTIVEADDTVSPPRYEIAFNRYPNQRITVVGHNDLVVGPQELAKKLYSRLNEDLVRSLNEKLSSDKVTKENKDSKEKKDTMAMNERKLSLDNNGNVVGGAIFGGSTPEIAPTFGAVSTSRKSEPDSVARHRKIVMGLNELYAKKNADYGDSFHETFKEEGMAMARIRLSDKLNRFKSLTRGNSQQITDESIRDTLLDLANYAIMTVIEMDREADAKAGA